MYMVNKQDKCVYDIGLTVMLRRLSIDDKQRSITVCNQFTKCRMQPQSMMMISTVQQSCEP